MQAQQLSGAYGRLTDALCQRISTHPVLHSQHRGLALITDRFVRGLWLHPPGAAPACLANV